MRALTLLVFLVGCGPAIDEPAYPAPSTFDNLPVPESEGASAPIADAPPAAPRLRKTKTLGQSDDVYGRGQQAQPGAPGSGPSTTVIVNNNIVQQASPTVIVTGPGTTSYGYAPSQSGSSSRGSSPSQGSTGSAPPVGGDWPQVPSYGPR